MADSNPRRPPPTDADDLQWPPPATDTDVVWLGSRTALPSDDSATSDTGPATAAAEPVEQSPRLGVESQDDIAADTPLAASGVADRGPAPVPIATFARPSSPVITAFERAPGPTPIGSFQRTSTVRAISAIEGAPARSASADASSTQAASVPLSRVLSKDVRLEWHEAVAVVLQLADEIAHLSRVASRGAVPDIDQIQLEATGHLHVRLEPTSNEPIVRSLGYLLHKLLTDLEGPVSLRLIVSQVVSNVPTIQSLEELTQELGRWERPRPPRLEKLALLYERARSTTEPLVPSNRAETPAVLDATPASVPERLYPDTRPILRPAQRRAVLAVILASCVLLAGAAIVATVRLLMPPRITILTTPETTAAPAEAAAENGAPRQDERAIAPASRARTESKPPASNARPVASNARPVASDAKKPTPRTIERVAPDVRAPAPAQIPRQDSKMTVASIVKSIQSAQPSPGVTTASPPAPVPQPQTDASRPAAPRPLEASRTGAGRPGPADPVYSSADQGVSEPVLVRPYLPENPPPGMPERTLGVLEILVDPTGHVESVRLRSPGNRYRERWWVFAAKNWEFKPAFKDGQPVRFLKRITITQGPSDPQ